MPPKRINKSRSQRQPRPPVVVETAEEHQAPVQKLADRVAAWLIPVVFVFLLSVYLVTPDLRKVVTLRIFTSPAELGLATPIVMIAAIARAARQGVLVKGGVYLELLAKSDVVVFDKTGTLTVGEPAVVKVYSFDDGYSEENVVRTAAAVDRRSSHPLAKAVVRRAQEMKLALAEPAEFESIHGRGVKATVDGKRVVLGNEALLRDNEISPPPRPSDAQGTVIYLAVDGKAVGALDLADEVPPGAKVFVERLKATGVKKTVMLTGDNEVTARRIGAELGIDEVHAGLLPEQKVDAIVALQAEKHRVTMVGDGVNDAPALARADVGIAMGARGTQAALLHLGPDVLVFINSIKLLRVRIES